MFKMTKVGAAAFLLTAAVGAQAQTTQRVEITGSAIKRVDAETSVPVTVVRMDDLRKEGVTTVEQIMKTLSAVQTSATTSQVVGSGSGGASFTDMRGIGANKTLVLLNGRRVANNAINGGAPDLNMIPFAALERVEVLRDGASSLYGTDAIGGVINFITRKDFGGGSITLGADKPQKSGGEQMNANVGFGWGNLDTNGVNVFGFVDFSKTNRISGTQRDYNLSPPGGLSPTPFPANYYQGSSETYNPNAPKCDAPYLTPADDTSCYIATARFVNYTPDAERISGLLRGSFRINQDHTASLEWFGTQNKVQSLIAPVPYGTLWMNPTRPDGTPNPFFPGAANKDGAGPIAGYDPAFTQKNMSPRTGITLQPGFVTVKWRDLATGQRTDDSTNKQQRLVAQLEGMFGNWDYRTGLSYNENKVTQNLSGYTNGNLISVAMLNGVINPFGAQTAEGSAAIKAAGLAGNLQNHSGKVTAWDGKISGEVGDWFGAGRSAAVALGAEFRREDFLSAANTSFAEKVQASTGVDPTSRAEGKRDVKALYAEMNLPITRRFEATLGVRYDNYSDFGSTTNPKIGLRYQPTADLLLRASASTGFRAPSLYDINTTPYYTNTGTVSDPVNCPGGTPIAGKSKAQNCNVQFQAYYGGNKSLKPEKSKNFAVGLVFNPMKDMQVSVDAWWIKLTDQIGNIPASTVLGDAKTFAQYYHRNAAGNLSIDGFSCPGTDCGYIDVRNQNLGELHTAGVDSSIRYNLRSDVGVFNMALNSTYVSKYDYQDYVGGPFNHNVGAFVGAGAIFRWQHAAVVSWSKNAFGAGLSANYHSGYADQDPADNPMVGSWSTVDGYVSWQPMKTASITFGVRNLLDAKVPYSNQGQVFQANYDPRYSDPTGRAYYLRLGYQF